MSQLSSSETKQKSPLLQVACVFFPLGHAKFGTSTKSEATSQPWLILLEEHTPMGWCDADVPRYLPVTWPQQQQWLWERSQQDSQKELANIIEAWKIPVSASLLSYSKNNPLFSISQGSLFNRSYATLLNKIKHSYSLHMLLNTATLK